MRFFACCGVAWAMLLGSCALNPLAPWEGPTLSESREQLTLEQLQSLQMPPLLDMSFMARPAWATPAREDFTGSLSFQEAPMTYLNAADAYAGENVFPAFQARFVSHQGTLIPLSQGLLRTMPDGSLWDVMLGTGKVWHEAGDGDWNRASFPLSLTDRFIGQVRNCVASFVYQSEQMSNVYVQCSQETADANDGRLGNLQGMLSADYVPGVSGEASALIASSLQARQERLPVQPLSAIDAQGEIAAYFNQSFLTSASTSAGAVMVEGQVYLHPPQTRHGLYPYPGEMRHGLYSVTKSMAGALALFYFAERYGDAIFDARITDYVPALRNHSGWQDVTFSHALNMVTGTEGGEDAEHLLNTIIVADTASESIANVAKLGDEPAEPGQQFNYASTHFFVLSYALQNYVEAREGKGVKYWDLLRENVLIPIGAAHFTVQHTQEDDGTLGIPFLAYGAAPTLDEAAKIAALFMNEGKFEGQQLLSQQRVREALGRTSWSGYLTHGDWRGTHYRHGFWSTVVETPACKIPVTYMLGFGGNYVIFLPNDGVIFRFMDEFDFEFKDLVRRVEKVIPVCRDA